MSAPEVEPMLATDASRQAHRRYLTTGDRPHEIVADAIHLAENRGVNAVLTALGAQIDPDMRQLYIPTGRFHHLEFQRRLEEALGRG